MVLPLPVASLARVRWLAFVLCVFALCSGCVLDWSDPNKGKDLPDSSTSDADAGTSDADPDAGRLGDGGVGADASEDPYIPPLPCGEGCPGNSQCDEVTNLCECDNGYAATPQRTCKKLDACELLGSSACGVNEVCQVVSDAASCACKENTTSCGDQCLDLRGDAKNCGECGLACAAGVSCENAQCKQPAAKLVLGRGRTCALMNDEVAGSYGLKCWGYSGNGFYRDPEDISALRPRAISGVARARDVAFATQRHCAILPDQDVVRCWGSCGKECGLASTTTLNEVFNDVAYPGVVSISSAMPSYVNTGNTCGLTGGGVVSCWGKGQMITLGGLSGSTGDRTSPWRVDVNGVTNTAFVDLSAAIFQTCATSAAKRVACWGMAGMVLGIPDGETNTPPNGVWVQKASGGDLTGALSVSAAGAGSCAVTDAKEVWCWGGNESGRVGSGNQTKQLTAVKVPLSGVVDVAAGGQHTCARQESGQVYCWGSVAYVGLGSAVAGDSADGGSFLTPQRVPGLEKVLEIRAHETHSCARLTTGQVVCWGDNADGQLGDGTTIQRFVPTPVVDLY